MPTSTKAAAGASVNHLVLNVRDIEVSHRFYTELLGFEQCGELDAHDDTCASTGAIRRTTTTWPSCR